VTRCEREREREREKGEARVPAEENSSIRTNWATQLGLGESGRGGEGVRQTVLGKAVNYRAPANDWLPSGSPVP